MISNCFSEELIKSPQKRSLGTEVSKGNKIFQMKNLRDRVRKSKGTHTKVAVLYWARHLGIQASYGKISLETVCTPKSVSPVEVSIHLPREATTCLSSLRHCELHRPGRPAGDEVPTMDEVLAVTSHLWSTLVHHAVEHARR